MSDRKLELERKKAKLQAIREEKERRRKEKEKSDLEDAVGKAGTTGEKDLRKDLDDMLSSLGVAPVSEVLSSYSSVQSNSTDGPQSLDTTDSQQTATLGSGGKRKPVNLMVVSVQATDIPPKETVVYTKQTQTTQAGTGHERDGKNIHFCITQNPFHSCFRSNPISCHVLYKNSLTNYCICPFI